MHSVAKTPIVPRLGFADPVLDGQSVFRTVMNALAEPGTIHTLDADRLAAIEAPLPLQPATAAILLALADFETPVHLDAPARSTEVTAFLRFHAGCPLVAERPTAAFALVTEPQALDTLDGFALGSLEYPDRSTTVVIQVESLEGGPIWILTGPGIAEERRIALAGLHPGLLAAIEANHAGFPQGVDLIFTDGARILGLPRSTLVTEEAG